MDRVQQALATLRLGVQATSSDVKQAYRDLVMVWHPDRFPSNSRLRAKAETRLKEINEAYRVLADYRSTKSARGDYRPTDQSSGEPGRATPHSYNARGSDTEKKPFLRRSRWGRADFVAAFIFFAVLVAMTGLSEWVIAFCLFGLFWMAIAVWRNPDWRQEAFAKGYRAYEWGYTRERAERQPLKWRESWLQGWAQALADMPELNPENES